MKHYFRACSVHDFLICFSRSCSGIAGPVVRRRENFGKLGLTNSSRTEQDRPVCGSLTWISILELLACDLHRIIFNQSNARDFPKISLLIITNRNCRIYNGPIRMLNTDQPSKVETTRF